MSIPISGLPLKAASSIPRIASISRPCPWRTHNASRGPSKQAQRNSSHWRWRDQALSNSSRPQFTVQRRVGTIYLLSFVIANKFIQNFHSSSPRFATPDPYKVLGVQKTPTAAELKKAYSGLAKKYHPDTNKAAPAKDKFTEAQA